MNDDMKETTLGELVRETRGSIRTGPFGTTLRASEYSADGVPVVSVGEVGYGTFRVHAETRRVGDRVLRRLPEYKLLLGDIVFGRKGAVDRSAAVRLPQAGWFLGSDGIRVRLGSGVDQLFVGYALQRMEAKQWLITNSTGTTMATLNQKVLDGVPLVMPPIAEQHAIVEAIDDVSSLEGSLSRVIAKQRAVKQGMMQALLTGRTRLPGFSGSWTSGTIGSFLTIVGGGTPGRSISSFWGGSIPWATVKDISRFSPSRTQEYITAAAVSGSASRVVPAGTPILAARMLVGKAVRFRIDVAINQDLKALFTGDDVDDAYLCHWFDANGSRLTAAASGSTVAGISTAQIKAMSIELPSADEQRAIARVLADADDELESLERRIEAAKAIKQGMMQELLTGRTRLPVKEEAA